MNQSDKLKRLMEKKVKSYSRKGNMTKIAKAAARIIKTRTRTGGKDVRDQPFKELAESTARAKWLKKSAMSKGRIKTKGKSVPLKYYRSILTETKKMLDALYGKGIANNVGIVYFKDNDEIIKASWNEKLGRIFFGISKADEKKLSNYIRELFRKEGGL